VTTEMSDPCVSSSCDNSGSGNALSDTDYTCICLPGFADWQVWPW